MYIRRSNSQKVLEFEQIRMRMTSEFSSSGVWTRAIVFRCEWILMCSRCVVDSEEFSLCLAEWCLLCFSSAANYKTHAFVKSWRRFLSNTTWIVLRSRSRCAIGFPQTDSLYGLFLVLHFCLQFSHNESVLYKSPSFGRVSNDVFVPQRVESLHHRSQSGSHTHTLMSHVRQFMETAVSRLH